ncbi:hypothetical protein GO730_38860 [Spirosoma sp. HMF3257]|uniref:Uncharacterized protein n=1 Tax=Spirosoma telluris TaxID=2183553 RepID=A0A327NDT3_9BACT|nr:hypothetical protein [Spirosoma telluris]RAI72863.1 hypothetical protein HMF3257_38785 [Spirosoma telluris]
MKKLILKPYQVLNAEGQPESAIKYFQGQPLIIRFNGQSGRFTRDGQDDLGDSLTITVIAWRFFRGELFGRAPAEYAELFYVDKNRNLCVVMFTNASAQNLRKFMANLSYSAFSGAVQTMLNTVIRIDARPRTRKDAGRYNVAEFTNCGPADIRATTAFLLFCQDHKVYRADTRTVEIEDVLWSATYFTMIGLGVKRDGAKNEEEQQQIQKQYNS